MKKKLVLLGPTGVGKTALAVEIALEWNAEIISSDSMQIYEGMRIGTACPSNEMMKIVPHHLIGFLSPFEKYNAKRYLEDATRIIQDVQARHKNVVITGGTGLYLKSLLLGLLPDESDDALIREQLEERVRIEGINPLREELKKADPEKYSQFPPNDHRRIIRAMSYYYSHGKPISSMQTQWISPVPDEFILAGLSMDRQELYRRLDKRVDSMVQEGLLEEVKALLAMKVPPDAVCWQAIGYKQLLKHLQGEYSFDKAVELIKRDSRHFAKRQWTWFNKMKDIHWFDMDSQSVKEQILNLLDLKT
ncbi:MAG: tRNA (adenosine(37)-N6)-dimethylallyltransferase MiaA [Candidatus Aureabacteria bacterium]|nr:tRNA (adenosine(37)-N6)-dimethylallyltransferase MiaA [Candidatus Auribacterota bacterium]